MRFKDRQCKSCGVSYTPTGPAHKYYVKCGKEREKLSPYKAILEYRIRQGSKVGVGKGGAVKRGKDHPKYSSGEGWFQSYSAQYKAKINRCERCGKDLTDATSAEWACHHRDHDRTNQTPENIELLCKRCHQIEHDCHKAIQGATTIPVRLPNGRFASGSSVQEDTKRATTLGIRPII